MSTEYPLILPNDTWRNIISIYNYDDLHAIRCLSKKFSEIKVFRDVLPDQYQKILIHNIKEAISNNRHINIPYYPGMGRCFSILFCMRFMKIPSFELYSPFYIKEKWDYFASLLNCKISIKHVKSDKEKIRVGKSSITFLPIYYPDRFILRAGFPDKSVYSLWDTLSIDSSTDITSLRPMRYIRNIIFHDFESVYIEDYIHILFLTGRKNNFNYPINIYFGKHSHKVSQKISKIEEIVFRRH